MSPPWLPKTGPGYKNTKSIPKNGPSKQESTGCSFVLYGGTAIALRLGHRFSVDFDSWLFRLLCG